MTGPSSVHPRTCGPRALLVAWGDRVAGLHGPTLAQPAGQKTYAYKPGGFVTGAGHGNTFQGNFGNYWNTGTPWWGLNFDFARRIALFLAAFDRDGLLFATTRFGDFPHYVPDRPRTGQDDLFTGWMLLFYHKPCAASSYRDIFAAANVTDENPRTFWVAASNHPGEWLAVDLGRPHEVRAVQVNFSDYKSGLDASDAHVFTQFKLLASLNGKDWSVLADLSGEHRDRPNAYLELPQPAQARYLKYEHGHVASPNLAISDLRIFGRGPGNAPATSDHLTVRRHGLDQRNAFISWDDVSGAVGYNILWGIGDDRLYQTYQVLADQRPARDRIAASPAS